MKKYLQKNKVIKAKIISDIGLHLIVLQKQNTVVYQVLIT